MEYSLLFNRQTWKPQCNGELTLFLPSRDCHDVGFDVNLEFVPSWLEEEDLESEHRTLHVMVQGSCPGLRDWRELVGCEVEGRDAVEVLGEIVTPEVHPPELEIWSSGKGAASIHTHARDGWETRLKLSRCDADDVYTFVCEVEAFFPSARAREISVELAVKEFFGELDLDDEEKAKLLEEGWRFRYRGRVHLDHLSCTVPLNTKDPIGWAKGMAKRELKMEHFGFCRVNGGEMDGSYKPEDGVCCNGRLVLLSPPSPWFFEWQQAEQEKKRKRDDGQQEEQGLP